MLQLYIGHNLQIVGGESRYWEGGSSKNDLKKVQNRTENHFSPYPR
jgi:hypothetical protein